MSTSFDSSPFLQDRFEHERSHLYYLPQPLFELIEQPKPAYLIGSRGTGKTTLLMALNWRERCQNKWLRSELGADPFEQKYLGVYLKLPEYKLGGIDAWLESENEDDYGLINGRYLELLFLETLVDGVAGLISSGVIQRSPDDEEECVGQILSDSFADCEIKAIALETPRSLRQLRRLFMRQRELIERHASDRSSIGALRSTLSPSQIGTFSRRVAADLARLCEGDSGAISDRRWFFKVALDEGETLSPRQQIVLNTLVRLSKWPLFPVAAFVRSPLEPIRTLAPGLTLAQADRDLILLDDTRDSTFRELAEGVASIRLRAYLKGEGKKRSFNTRKCLGSLDINGVLQSLLGSSVNPEAKLLLKQAKELGEHEFFGGSEKNTKKHLNSLPIYQTYLINRLKLDLPTPGTPAWQRRKQESADLRKKMVAAYLCICFNFNLKVRYSSADMVLQLCDKRIRDFLSFMNSIHVESKLSADKLFDSKIPSEIQDAAIRRTSNEKRENIRESGVAAPTHATRLINAIGMITQIVQTRGGKNQELLATERGFFRVNVSEKDSRNYESVLSMIREAAEAGYLHIKRAEGRTWRFRLHTSLAPAFSCSYRGAYYDTAISLGELSELYSIVDQDERNKAIIDLGNQLAAGSDEALPLFEVE